MKTEDQNEKTLDSVRTKNNIKNEGTAKKTKENKREEVNEKLKTLASESDAEFVSRIDTKGSNANALPQSIISPVTLPRPIFYPQVFPMGGTVRGMQGMQALQGMQAMRFPFMIPQLGVPGIPAPMQPIHPLMSPISKDNKPLHELSRLVTEQKDIIDIPSAIDRNIVGQLKHRQSAITPSSVPPPSHHTQIPKGPLTSGTVRQKGPVGPAHTNGLKRSNPFNEPSKNANSFPGMHLKSSRTNISKNLNEMDLKRQKMSVSPEHNVFQTSSRLGEMPALDLSMKTMRAQEEKQRRGESLLFSTCFNKSSKTVLKKDGFEAPQDLSLKSQSSSSHSSAMKSTSASIGSAKHTPLNVPLHPIHSETRLSASGGSKVALKSGAVPQSEEKKEKSSLGSVPPFSMGAMSSTIAGLPLELASAFIHPAFPTPMMMQSGGFPTPVQLQQMIQGQVAASFPLLRPGDIQNPVQLFQPAFSVSSSGVSCSSAVKTDSK